MIYTVTLNACIDASFSVQELIKDDSNRAQSAFYTPGGKGFNVSKVVHELGGQSKAYGVIAGDAGEYWLKLVQSLDIPHHVYRVKGQTRINVAVNEVDKKIQTRINAPGPLISKKDETHLKKLLVRRAQRGEYWVLSGTPAPGFSGGIYRELIEHLHKKGAHCVLDADGIYLGQGIQANPFLIKPNLFELERLLGVMLRKFSDIQKAAQELAKSRARIVIVSMGDKGALFVSSKETFLAQSIKVKEKSEVGAGDTLVGAFLWAHTQKKSFSDCIRISVAAAASTVARQTAYLCSRQDVIAWKSKVKINKI